MTIPFTTEQFMAVFRDYNTDIWPIQIILYAMALITVIFTLFKFKSRDRVNGFLLSFLWIWMGIIYHLTYFTDINKAAYLFGSLFIVQGGLFAYEGIIKDRLTFQYPDNFQGIAGAILIIYALLLYPFIGFFISGHLFPSAPTFGLPCPTTIFTFGLLLWTKKVFAKYLLIIPLLWTIIGFNAALWMGVIEDYGLLIGGIIAAGFLIFRKQPVKA
jgi:hypothetical protein